MNLKTVFILGLLIFTNSCKNPTSDTNSSISEKAMNKLQSKNLLKDFPAINKDGFVNAVVEIPSGTTEKWELNKASGKIEWEKVEGDRRIVNYIGYPGNYGMIPQTLLAKANGGDGDPLDILVLGPPAARGSVVSCKLIGVLYLKDRGEQDDKLIAVAANSPFENLQSIEDLNQNFYGVSKIISTWFSNYKGPDMMQAEGFGDAEAANKVLLQAIKEYKSGN